MREVIETAAAVGISLFATAAIAQEATTSTFGKQFVFVLSAERLLGLSFTNDKEENFAGTEETKRTTTEFGFSSKPGSRNPYFLPQLGLDFFVIDHLSVGLGLTYWHISGDEKISPPPTDGPASRQLDDTNLFRITPRVGFGMMFTNIVGLWARGGLSYYNRHSEAENGDENSENGAAVTVEGLLMLSPFNHVAFGVGPAVDFGISGEEEDNPSDPNEPTSTADRKRNQYGLMSGLSIWF